jgi:predicted hydrocarbon binding protein
LKRKIDDESLHFITQFLDLDITKGEMRLFNQRVGIFPLKSVLEVFSALKDELGFKKTKEIIYKTGFRFGKNLLESIVQLDRENLIDLNPLQGREAISKILTFFGLGKIEYITYDDKNQAVLNYFNSPVVETEDNLFCIFLSGLIKSITERIFEKSVKVIESKCITKNDNCCSFEINF